MLVMLLQGTGSYDFDLVLQSLAESMSIVSELPTFISLRPLRLTQFFVFHVGRQSYQSFFFFSSRRRHTRLQGDWSSDVCSSDLCRWSAPRRSRHSACTARRRSAGSARASGPTRRRPSWCCVDTSAGSCLPLDREIGRAHV